MNKAGIAVLLMVLATAVSTVQMIRARTAISTQAAAATELKDDRDRLQSELELLRKTQDSKTTYVAVFPNNLPRITKLIEATDDHLVIVVDHCGYGHYSDPQRYLAYKSALIGLRQRGKDVELHIYDEPTEKMMTASQFGLDQANPDEAFGRLRGDPRFKAYFAYYDKVGRPKPVAANAATFLALMHDEQMACIQELEDKGIMVARDQKKELPVFVWVRDNNVEAIFSVYNIGARTREVSLLTQDPGLLNLLGDIAVRRR